LTDASIDQRSTNGRFLSIVRSVSLPFSAAFPKRAAINLAIESPKGSRHFPRRGTIDRGIGRDIDNGGGKRGGEGRGEKRETRTSGFCTFQHASEHEIATRMRLDRGHTRVRASEFESDSGFSGGERGAEIAPMWPTNRSSAFRSYEETSCRRDVEDEDRREEPR